MFDDLNYDYLQIFLISHKVFLFYFFSYLFLMFSMIPAVYLLISRSCTLLYSSWAAL